MGSPVSPLRTALSTSLGNRWVVRHRVVIFWWLILIHHNMASWVMEWKLILLLVLSEGPTSSPSSSSLSLLPILARDINCCERRGGAALREGGVATLAALDNCGNLHCGSNLGEGGVVNT